MSENKMATPIDTHSHAEIGIDVVHAKIHDGQHYYISGFVTLNSSSTYGVRFVTPDTSTHMHFEWDVRSSGITELGFYEGAAGTITGTTLTAFNNNRNSSKTTLMEVYGSTTVSTTGTVIDSAKWGAAQGVVRVGGGSTRDDELELKQNTSYYGLLTSFNDSNIIQFRASWYEL